MNRQGTSGTPISAQGTVKVNGAIDDVTLRRRHQFNGAPLYYASREIGDYSARKHELAFFVEEEINKTAAPLGRAVPTLKVVTTLNALSRFETTKKDDAAVRRETRRRITFVGVNDTDFDARQADQRSNHAAVTVAGSVTVLNESEERINIGDTIVWDIPPFDKGEAPADPRRGTKRRLLLRPLAPVDKLLLDARAPKRAKSVEAFMNRAQAVCDEIKRAEPEYNDVNLRDELFERGFRVAEAETYLKPDLVAAYETFEEERARVVGKALTKAQPGQHFDLLLGYAHV